MHPGSLVKRALLMRWMAYSKLRVAHLVAGALVFCLGTLGAKAQGKAAQNGADSFDRPLTQKVVTWNEQFSPEAGSREINVSCYFYKDFEIKEYNDRWLKGAELSIRPRKKDNPAECTREHLPDNSTVEWSGYFRGVKGKLVFFNAPDGRDGGLPFAVFDATTGEKIFEDSAYDSTGWSKKPAYSPFNHLRVTAVADGRVLLTFLRVVATDCDFRTEKKACWPELKAKYDLKTETAPACIAYGETHGRWSSALAYPVEVSLFPKPTTKTIEGPLKCWPVD